MSHSEAARNALVSHLHTLTEQQLADLASARRELTVEPAPATLNQLALRMLSEESIGAACSDLSRPELQVAEAVAALGDGWTVARLAALMGVPADDPVLLAIVERLAGKALIWRVGVGFAGDHLEEFWPEPLGLGPRAGVLLLELSLPQLRRLAQTLGAAPARLKPDVVAAVAERLSEVEVVREIVARASAADRRLLRDLAIKPMETYAFAGYRLRSALPDLPWAEEHGLLIRTGWGGSGQMPREAALALRGEGYRAPFEAEPPVLVTEPVAVETVERDAAAAATETLAALTAVLESVGRAPVGLLKTGGLGVRELRKLAKSAGHDEARTRLSVELAAAGGLALVETNELTVGLAYDQYAAAEPADQLLGLVQTWLQMPACPLAPPEPGTPDRALSWAADEEDLLVGMRSAVLRMLDELVAEGRAVTAEAVTRQFVWRQPMLAEDATDGLDRYLTGIWREAHAIGLLAHGTPTALCRRAVAGQHDELRETAAAMVPAVQATVVLQNDLTAVVTGTPSTALLALLDGMADPESRSGAWTWRFSPGSVLRAFDAGAGAPELLERLREVAAGGRLPQALGYLIEDVARRHGQVRVQPVGCCLCADDEALLTEILHTRSLGSLGLVRLAPTVLASAKPQAETLSALRRAGFAPAGTNADGTPAIERIPQRRAPVAAEEWDEPQPEIRLVTPGEFAARLVRSA